MTRRIRSLLWRAWWKTLLVEEALRFGSLLLVSPETFARLRAAATEQEVAWPSVGGFMVVSSPYMRRFKVVPRFPRLDALLRQVAGGGR